MSFLFSTKFASFLHIWLSYLIQVKFRFVINIHTYAISITFNVSIIVNIYKIRKFVGIGSVGFKKRKAIVALKLKNGGARGKIN